jgi:hypothetical protein
MVGLVGSFENRRLTGFRGLPGHKADNLTAICEPTVWKMWEPRRLTTLWASTAYYRDSFAFLPRYFCTRKDIQVRNASLYFATTSLELCFPVALQPSFGPWKPP